MKKLLDPRFIILLILGIIIIFLLWRINTDVELTKVNLQSTLPVLTE